MIKEIINSDAMTWFRKSYLNKLHKKISRDELQFCCYFRSWHRLFICWKELKEVKENMKSSYLSGMQTFGCGYPWFHNKRYRLLFLEECISKFDKNEQGKKGV